jgi:hypothetical protein
MDLWNRVRADAGYRSWAHAPRYPFKMASNTAHGSEVEVFVNAPLAQAIDGKPATEIDYAAMEKRGGKWFWAEFDAEGEPIYSGEPAICLDCHRPRQKTGDWLYTVELPR